MMVMISGVMKVENGIYCDTGDKLGYLKTVVDFALQHEDIKDDFRAYLKGIVYKKVFSGCKILLWKKRPKYLLSLSPRPLLSFLYV